MLYPIHLLTILVLLISRVNSLPHATPRQDASSSNTTASSATIVDETIVNKLEGIRSRWGMKGINIAVVASPEYMGNKTGSNQTGWATQSIALGQANRFGDAFDDQTLFALGSNSKHFAAVAVALLIENGTTLPDGQPLTYNKTLPLTSFNPQRVDIYHASCQYVSQNNFNMHSQYNIYYSSSRGDPNRFTVVQTPLLP
ncbi:hypothetical protein I204_02051 [Kwoniella mangroviensis CBS 8886]|uniref:uncharacterized protein n=1 Tax=Kwoniella mangroviensis CBS 8507 TaxID=1296122 RepID=UPI00080CFB6C|nr:uncharacterized protein I203_03642 [Kwoniella mangroviensis CBS 8507]OCF66960.1 hypothetical protein I203_03642 [Kwoniella mangroviensis CBS 8507]OCF78045.1 hypothetical protein I204_02051 [Kwoniella mangroviensis CBS 8886]